MTTPLVSSPPPRSLSTTPSTPHTPTSTTNVSYESFAPRSTAQISRLSRLAALTAGPTALALQNADNVTAPRKGIMKAMLVPSENMEEDWMSVEQEEDGNSLSSALISARTLTDQLTLQLKHTTSLRLALRASVNIADDLSNRHAELLRHSGELSAAADRLQEEEEVLTRHAEEIGKPLQHYDAVDRIGVRVGVLFKGNTTVRGLAQLKVDHEDEFPKVLEEIDNAVEYFGRESGGKEVLHEELKRRTKDKKKAAELLSGNVEYYRRSLALQDASLSLIKEAVADRITTTANQIAAALQLPKKPVPADQLEASLIYTRFHGISSRSNRLMKLVKARIQQQQQLGQTHTDAYIDLLQSCRQTYCAQRELLLAPTIRSHMDKLKQQHGPVGMTRLASVFLIRFCTVETSLYLDFFGDLREEVAEQQQESDDATRKKSKKASLTDDATYKDAVFQDYLTNMCTSLHRTVRRSLVTMLELDTLCQIVSVLREERSLASSSPTTMAAARAISSVIEDAQERLIFCANTTLNKEVVRFKATPKDLNYPDKLIKNETDTTDKVEEDAGDVEAMEKKLEEVYESWFPPVRGVLKILSKIFRVVEPKVFEDLALQSVQACTKSLKSASDYIRNRKGVMHSDLFLVKHLLILREQLSPFDIELRSVERQLDFSDAGKAMARFLANRNRRLFSIKASENALFTLLREGVSVQEADVDSKRDLEDALRAACNDFIEHTSQQLAGDFVAVVAKCSSSETNELVRESLLHADSVVDGLLVKCKAEEMEAKLRDIATQMALYLDNPGTQNILMKPVSRKVTKAVEELRKRIAPLAEPAGWTQEKKSQAEGLLQGIELAVKKQHQPTIAAATVPETAPTPAVPES